MGLFEQFPYTNFHELNLDWILKKVKEFDERLNSFHDTLLAEANAYTDSHLAGIRADFAALEGEFAAFKVDVNKQFAQYTAKTDREFSAFEDLVNAKLILIQQDIRDAKAELQTLLSQSIAYTDNQFSLLYDNLPTVISKYIGQGLVYNLLEGRYQTLQAMLDYLCLFHAPGALTCGQVFTRNNTCQDCIDYNRSCSEFTLDIKNFYVQK